MSEIKQVSLSDQMGVMAVIDGLRHRHDQVNEVLNAKVYENTVAEKLRDYYIANGVLVTDELIDEGINTFYKSRYELSYKPLTKSQAFIAKHWMARSSHLKLARNVTLIAALGFAGGTGIEHMYVAGQYNDAISNYQIENETTLKTLSLINERLIRQKAGLSLIDAGNRNESFLKTVDMTVRKNEGLVVNLIADTFKLNSSDDISKIVNDAGEILKVYDAKNQPGTHDLDVIKKKTEFMIQRNIDMQKALTILSVSDTHIRSAQSFITISDSYKVAKAAVDKIPLNVEDRAVFDRLSDSIDRAMSNLSLDDKNIILNLDKTLEHVKNYTELADYAKTPITLRVTNEPNVKSGVERTYTDEVTKQKGLAWYAIVEARNDLDELFPIQVRSSETNETEKRSRYGISISKEAFVAMKRDKLDNGHIDNNLIGNKPANKLNFKYEGAVTNPVNFILNWSSK